MDGLPYMIFPRKNRAHTAPALHDVRSRDTEPGYIPYYNLDKEMVFLALSY